MKKFLLVNPFGIGDVLFTTPVIRAIRDAYPDSFIGYWCNQRVAGVLKSNPAVNAIFALSRGDIKKIFGESKVRGIVKSLGLLAQIRKQRFNICIDFSLDHRYNFISKISGIKERIGFNFKKRGRFLTQKIELEGYNSKHVVEYYLDLAKSLGFQPEEKSLCLCVEPQEQIKAKSQLAALGINEGDLIIAIAPGGGVSWGKDAALKHWPVEKFARLADILIKDFRAKILILGDDSERPLAEAILARMSQKAVDFTGKTSLQELIALIDRVKIMVANDGGLLHIACALDKRTVSFFGPVDPKVYGPYPQDQDKHIVLRRELECSPCYRNFRLNPCRHNRECMNKIEPDEAITAISRLLSLRGDLR